MDGEGATDLPGVPNQRIVLEAKQMLAHSDEPAATIGGALGFIGSYEFPQVFRTPHIPTLC